MRNNVVLKFLNWFHSEEIPFFDKLIKIINVKYPKICIESENIKWGDLHNKLQHCIADNSIPDIINLKGHDISTFAEKEVLLDISSYDFMNNVTPVAREGLKYKGNDYGLAYTSLYQGVFYNKKYFKKYKLNIPGTYDELANICNVLKENGITPWATHFKNLHHIGNMIMQFAIPEVFMKNPNWGSDLYEGKTSFKTSQEYRKVFERLKDVYNYTWEDTCSLELSDAGIRMANEEAAMMCTGTWIVQYLEQNPDLDYGVFPFPGSDKGAKLIYEPNHTFSISKTTKYKEEALDVIRLLVSNKNLNQYLLGMMNEYSLLKDVLPVKESKATLAINEWVEKGKVIDVCIGNSQVKWPLQEEYSKHALDWISGKILLDEVLSMTDEFKENVT